MPREQYEYTKTITVEQVEHIMYLVIYRGGITNWVTWIREDKEAPRDKKIIAMDRFITNGGAWYITDQKTKIDHRFDIDTLLKGLSLYTNSDYDNYDKVDVDYIVQLGIFGEIIYKNKTKR